MRISQENFKIKIIKILFENFSSNIDIYQYWTNSTKMYTFHLLKMFFFLNVLREILTLLVHDY